MDIGDELSPSPAFPDLTAGNHQITSDRSAAYNCIAWAAGEESRWWWPDEADDFGVSYWPEEVPCVEGSGAFISAFGTLGYAVCEDASFLVGFEKVAIYVKDGLPTHAARQTPDGNWTSKLGQGFDIRHTFEAIEGPSYGQASLFMARLRADRPHSAGPDIPD